MKIKYIYANYQMLIFLSYKQRFIKNQVKWYVKKFLKFMKQD